MLGVLHLVFHIAYTGSLQGGFFRMDPNLSLSYVVLRQPLAESAAVGIYHTEGVPHVLQYMPRLAWLVVVFQVYQWV